MAVAKNLLTLLQDDPQFVKPVLWSDKRRPYPSVRWRTSDDTRIRLVIRCNDDPESIARDPSLLARQCLNKEAWQPARRDARNDQVYEVTL